MKTLIATTAAIQFVGLCILMNGDTTAPVHVVLPRIEAITIPATARMQAPGRNNIELVQLRGRRSAIAAPAQRHHEGELLDGIDAHSAIIAFIGAPLQGSNWTYKQLKPAPTYNYVDLAGEHVQVLMPDSNEWPNVPSGLPHVRNGCNDQQRQLNADYQPPLYPKAAGVVRITGGRLTSCTPTINGIQSSRVDTRWEFDTPGPIVIETTNHANRNLKKKLVLDPTKVVMIGNVPTPWLNSAPMQYSSALHNEAGHYRAFYRMLTGQNDGCAHGLVDASPCPGSVGFKPPRGSDNGPVQQRLRAQGTGKGVPTSTASTGCPACMETYSCSNSQYP